MKVLRVVAELVDDGPELRKVDGMKPRGPQRYCGSRRQEEVLAWRKSAIDPHPDADSCDKPHTLTHLYQTSPWRQIVKRSVVGDDAIKTNRDLFTQVR